MGEERLFMEDSLKNQAYREIRQKILTCEYPPGTVLNEAFLCEALSISRTPVRDALSRLEHDHLLQIISKKGIVIESITLSDIGNYFEVLLRLVQTAVQDSGKNVDTGELLIFRQFFSDMRNRKSILCADAPADRTARTETSESDRTVLQSTGRLSGPMHGLYGHLSFGRL